MIDVQLVVKLGIIGYRNHAGRLIDIVKKRSDSSIEVIYHPSKSLSDVKSTTNFQDLFKTDGIIIASPNQTHFDYISKLEGYNGHIFCEKPPVTSFEHLNILKKFPEERKKKIYFNFNFRFSKISQFLKNQLDSTNIGKVIHIDIKSTYGLAFKKEYLESWRSDGKKNLHNILDTLSVHYIDLIIFLLGKPKTYQYIPKLISKNGTSYDTNFIVLKYDNDITVSILNSYAAPFIQNISIIGTNGYSSISDNEFTVYSPRNTLNSEGFFITPPIYSKSDFNAKDDYSYSLEKSVDYFVSCIKDEKLVQNSYFENSLESVLLILQMANQEKI